MNRNRISRRLCLSGLLFSTLILSSCQGDSMRSAVEQAAEDAKSKIKIGSPSAAAMSTLREDGFSCQPIADRAQETGAPSFLCNKMVEERRWLGLVTYYNHVRIFIDADETGNIISADVRVIRGGLGGL